MRGCSRLTRARSLRRKVHLPRRDREALHDVLLIGDLEADARLPRALRHAPAPRDRGSATAGCRPPRATAPSAAQHQHAPLVEGHARRARPAVSSLDAAPRRPEPFLPAASRRWRAPQRPPGSARRRQAARQPAAMSAAARTQLFMVSFAGHAGGERCRAPGAPRFRHRRARRRHPSPARRRRAVTMAKPRASVASGLTACSPRCASASRWRGRAPVGAHRVRVRRARSAASCAQHSRSRCRGERRTRRAAQRP